MAEILPMTEEQKATWRAWVASCPPAVRAVAERFWPNRLYRMQPTGQRVTLHSFGEPDDHSSPVTLSVVVSGRYNLAAFERRVFGVDPDSLEECDLPAPDEVLGSADMDPAEFVVGGTPEESALAAHIRRVKARRS